MNVHWLAPTQTPRVESAFLQYNLEPHHSCIVHSWGLESTSACPWIPQSSGALLTRVHWGRSGTVLQPWATGNSQQHRMASATCQERRFGRSATQKGERNNILPGITSVFQKLDVNSAAPLLLTKCIPSPGMQNGKTSCHRIILWDCVFHHNYNKLETCTVDIAAPKLSGLSSYLPAFSTVLTSSHLAHSGFLKFDHKGLPIHL